MNKITAQQLYLLRVRSFLENDFMIKKPMPVTKPKIPHSGRTLERLSMSLKNCKLAITIAVVTTLNRAAIPAKA